MASAQAEARTAIADLRRLVGGIAPAVLTDRGLDAALSALVASCRIPVSLDVRPGPRLPDAVEVAAYFVVSEALVNAQKHAEAASATVHLRRQGDRLVVEVADEGPGLPDATLGYVPPGPDQVGGRGLWLAWSLADDAGVDPDGPGTRIRLQFAR